MSGYTESIIRATGCSEADAAEIETLMRLVTGGTLDHLTRHAFDSTAREAEAALEILREEDPAWVTI